MRPVDFTSATGEYKAQYLFRHEGQPGKEAAAAAAAVVVTIATVALNEGAERGEGKGSTVEIGRVAGAIYSSKGCSSAEIFNTYVYVVSCSWAV